MPMITEAPAPRSVKAWMHRRRPDATFAPRWWWAVVAVAITAAVHAFVAWEQLGPLFAADEVGTVGAANTIANGGTDWILAGSGYMPGTALLLAPAWWFSDDAFTVYRVGLVVGFGLTMATIIPLARIARAVGVRSTAGSVVVASVVMLAPARTVSSNYVVSEQLLTLITAGVVAGAFWVVRRPSVGGMATIGALGGLAFLAHGRGVGVVIGVGVWSLLVARRRWRLWATSVGAAAAVVVGSWALYRWVAGGLYWSDDRVNQTFSGVATHTPLELLGTAFGLAWYLMAAWPAVGLVGFAIALRRRRHLDGNAMLLLAAAPTLVLALIQLDKTSDIPGFIRLDAWIYGRYLDHLFVVAAAIGLAILVRVRATAIPVFVGAIGAVVAAGFLAITVPQIPDGGAWAHLHVSGVVYMLSYQNYLDGSAEPWLLLTVAAWTIAMVVVLAAWRQVAPLVLTVLWVALSVASDATIVDPHDEPKRITRAASDALSVLPIEDPVGFDIEYGLGINAFTFGLHPRDLVVTTVADGVDVVPGIYTVYADLSPMDHGALPFGEATMYNFWFWVYPGPLFDQLEAEQKLAHPSTDAN